MIVGSFQYATPTPTPKGGTSHAFVSCRCGVSALLLVLPAWWVLDGATRKNIHARSGSSRDYMYPERWR